MEQVPEVDITRASELVADGAYLLDVREQDEWDAGHAPQATRIGEIPNDRMTVVICRSGGRSARVTRFLVGNGFDAVNVAGGMKHWAAEDLPLVADGGAAPQIA
jgi:rhodanese-related sulfurtransferase